MTGSVVAEEKPTRVPVAKIGPGSIIMVVGPSGAGKDTLLDGARDRLAGDDRYVFPRRLVTRKSDPSCEDHEEIERADFDRLVEAGSVGLSWEAHGLGYVIPNGIKEDVRAGRTVIFNSSRGAVGAARQEYEKVAVVHVTVPADVLAARLHARGRENPSQIADRLRKAAQTVDPDWIELSNDDTVEVGVGRLVQAIIARGA